MDPRNATQPVRAGLNRSFDGVLRCLDLWEILPFVSLSLNLFSESLHALSYFGDIEKLPLLERVRTPLRLISFWCFANARSIQLTSIRRVRQASFVEVAYSPFLSVLHSHSRHRPMSSKEPLRTDAVKAAMGMMRAISIITASAIPT